MSDRRTGSLDSLLFKKILQVSGNLTATNLNVVMEHLQ